MTVNQLTRRGVHGRNGPDVLRRVVMAPNSVSVSAKIRLHCAVGLVRDRPQIPGSVTRSHAVVSEHFALTVKVIT